MLSIAILIASIAAYCCYEALHSDALRRQSAQAHYAALYAKRYESVGLFEALLKMGVASALAWLEDSGVHGLRLWDERYVCAASYSRRCRIILF